MTKPLDWLKSEKIKIKSRARFGSKKNNYLHFDLRRSVRSAANYINLHGIKTHAFYPFIRIDIKRRRFVLHDGIKKVIDKEPRPIYYASHLDSYIYSYYSFLISGPYEQLLSKLDLLEVVIAYRSVVHRGKKMNTLDFANEVFNKIRMFGNCVVLTYDIKDFYESLDHSYLKSSWLRIFNLDKLPTDHYKVYRSLTNYYFVRKDLLYKILKLNKPILKSLLRLCDEKAFREIIGDKSNGLLQPNPYIATSKRGIPQGTPISGMLANIYLLEFDTQVKYISDCNNCFYKRYSDDIVVVCPNKIIAKKINLSIRTELKKYYLETNDKSKEFLFKRNKLGIIKVHNTDGVHDVFQYLGLEYDGTKVFIRSSSVARYYQRMKRDARNAMKKFRKGKIIPKYLLYKRNTFFGDKNFIRYAYSAAGKSISNGIEKQVKPHFLKLQKELKDWKK